MKYLLTLYLALVMVGSLNAQTNLVIFSKEGERFWLVINGVRQNAKPSANVRVEELKGDIWKAKVVFANETLPEIDKNLYALEQGTEQTYIIKKNRKKEYVMRFFNQANINPPTNENSQETVTYHETVNEPDPPAFRLRIGKLEVEVNDPAIISPPSPRRRTRQPDPRASSNSRCRVPMSSTDFREAQNSLEDADFESSRLSVAKQIANSNCLSSQQVKAVMEMFDFESSRVEFAKHAYNLVFDKQNYYIVNEAFDFSLSVDDLEEYIEQQR